MKVSLEGLVGPDRGTKGEVSNLIRQRGFAGQRRIETLILNDRRARQGAVVGKFMTFMNKKNALMVESLYNKNEARLGQPCHFCVQ